MKCYTFSYFLFLVNVGHPPHKNPKYASCTVLVVQVAVFASSLAKLLCVVSEVSGLIKSH